MFFTMRLVELRSVSVQKTGNVSKAILKNKHMKSKNLEKTQNVNFPLFHGYQIGFVSFLAILCPAFAYQIRKIIRALPDLYMRHT